MVVAVRIERCDECGFDGDAWDDVDAIDAICELPAQWREAIGGISHVDCIQRPIADTWSIAEYTDHVREVLFGMRFLLDSATSDPGLDLGASPEPSFDPTPRDVDVSRALHGIEQEADALARRLVELGPESWSNVVILDGDAVDARWICRHAIHDATHHLMDIDRLRIALSSP